ncbi:MAG: hypothetical protein GY832_46640 [Chloroflexi bacterium]|nr:hypothetical protein [Chloroflexota bacterium]
MNDKTLYYLELNYDSQTKEVSLKGSAAALASLAENILAMTQRVSSKGSHLHYDEFVGLTGGNASLTVCFMSDEAIPPESRFFTDME